MNAGSQTVHRSSVVEYPKMLAHTATTLGELRSRLIRITDGYLGAEVGPASKANATSSPSPVGWQQEIDAEFANVEAVIDQITAEVSRLERAFGVSVDIPNDPIRRIA